MSERDPTCIGRVRHVLGATITVALDTDLAGVSPIYRGRLQPLGQIGSLVRIPQGLVDLIATVNLVGIAELAGPLVPAEAVQCGERWLQVELLGEIDRGTGHFQRGVGSYPGLDDPVHFATPDQLRSVFPPPDAEHVRLGCLAAAAAVPSSATVTAGSTGGGADSQSAGGGATRGSGGRDSPGSGSVRGRDSTLAEPVEPSPRGSTPRSLPSETISSVPVWASAWSS